MKRNHNQFLSSIAMVAMLFFVFNVQAQTNFQVKWAMDLNLIGVSSHANFSPSNAALFGGANTYALNGGYGFGDAIVAGYVARPWPASFSAGRYVEFKFTANSFKYNITSISFRLRRSADGPPQIKVRTSMDNFSADLGAYTLSDVAKFNSYSIPVSFNNLTANTFALRIYGYGSNTIYGTLWFDEIIINGQVLAIILPVDLTYFKAEKRERNIGLSWETTWEKNSKAFEIERSTDLQIFETIGTLNAAGETAGRTQYNFTDENPLASTSYYRLKMIDQDDSFSFSNVIDVVNVRQETTLIVAPNPASPEKITFTGLAVDPSQINLTSITGIPISFHFESAGTNRMHLYPDKPLKSGLYLLTYQKNGRKEHVKILVP
ncbi:T9SS type A sorting domain-containing protein [Dyadobacter luticola]|uniref:T9SS type A sorting domain-containing protein n=1 Tax=Dyadobacter luticola TaxID=1979387 RepID=A0A5R9KVQ6_9BACT|nr:T9SS type A sorting domain-containing protein [Dyadobacter luticola]TLV00324.1 T9SS type A sorting domain-containing protein [Dyadobacter luticola]